VEAILSGLHGGKLHYSRSFTLFDCFDLTGIIDILAVKSGPRKRLQADGDLTLYCWVSVGSCFFHSRSDKSRSCRYDPVLSCPVLNMGRLTAPFLDDLGRTVSSKHHKRRWSHTTSGTTRYDTDTCRSRWIYVLAAGTCRSGLFPVRTDLLFYADILIWKTLPFHDLVAKALSCFATVFSVYQTRLAINGQTFA